MERLISPTLFNDSVTALLTFSACQSTQYASDLRSLTRKSLLERVLSVTLVMLRTLRYSHIDATRTINIGSQIVYQVLALILLPFTPIVS